MSSSTNVSAETNPNLNPLGAQVTKPAAASEERRTRRRAKITAAVHVRGIDAPEPFEEVCKSVDVSRDGILIHAARTGYWKGQQLEVTFPYSAAAAAATKTPGQRAEVVRVTEVSNGHFQIAVHFASSKPAGPRSENGNRVGAAPAATGQLTQTVVLGVESDPKVAEIMRTILANDGYTVIIVPSAQEALDILRTTVPAVFIAEVEGPEMSGHDLCLIVKRNERLSRVPVILVTASAQPADYSASHQMGAVVCMAKPFKPERLLHVVRLVAPPPQLRSPYQNARIAGNAVERSI
jgi:CheY-like chemotaxis protein